MIKLVKARGRECVLCGDDEAASYYELELTDDILVEDESLGIGDVVCCDCVGAEVDDEVEDEEELDEDEVEDEEELDEDEVEDDE